MGVFDFKSIRRSLEHNEQKADFEEKNPKPDPNKVVWSPEYGYGMVAVPFSLDLDLANMGGFDEASAISVDTWRSMISADVWRSIARL